MASLMPSYVSVTVEDLPKPEPVTVTVSPAGLLVGSSDSDGPALNTAVLRILPELFVALILYWPDGAGGIVNMVSSEPDESVIVVAFDVPLNDSFI